MTDKELADIGITIGGERFLDEPAPLTVRQARHLVAEVNRSRVAASRLEAEKVKRLSDYGLMEAWLQKAKRDHEGRLDIDGEMKIAEADWAERCLVAEAEVEKLRSMYAASCDRVVGQSELLSKTAEGKAVRMLETLSRLAVAAQDKNVPTVSCTYTNHKGETAARKIAPSRLWFGTHKPYHGTPQWLLEGWCLDRKAWRTFAVSKLVLDPEEACSPKPTDAR